MKTAPRQRGSEPEFSRVFDCRKLKEQPATVEIEADPAERAALAERFGIREIGRLTAKLRISRETASIVAISGQFRARVTQICVVTLEPFESEIEEALELRFGSETPDEAAWQSDEPLPLDDEDWLEPMAGGRIDLGEAVAQHLSLALDPHPRAPKATFEAGAAGADDDGGENPFRQLKDRLDSDEKK